MLWQWSPLCTPSSYPSPTPCSASWTTIDPTDTQYVFAHLDGMPTYEAEGTPQGSGDGFAHTRTGKDPMQLACAAAGGSCGRQAWAQYIVTSLVTSYFTDGVFVGYSGGTGYADRTLFTSTGGGANCAVNGIMTASGGVPNGIETSWGAPQPLLSTDSLDVGMGSGCASAPTLVLTNPDRRGRHADRVSNHRLRHRDGERKHLLLHVGDMQQPVRRAVYAVGKRRNAPDL